MANATQNTNELFEEFFAEVQSIVDADRPWYYDQGGYRRSPTIYDGELELLQKMQKLYNEKYRK